MSSTIEIRITKKSDKSTTKATQSDYLISYLENDQIVGNVELQVDTLQVNYRKYCLINVGEMKVPNTIDKATLMQQTKRVICRYFWRAILFQKVYIWSDATVCEMDYSNSIAAYRQELTLCKTFLAILAHISEKYYGEQHEIAAKAQIMYLRHDLAKAIPLFVAANPIHRDGLGLINFGRVSSLDLLG